MKTKINDLEVLMFSSIVLFVSSFFMPPGVGLIFWMTGILACYLSAKSPPICK